MTQGTAAAEQAILLEDQLLAIDNMPIGDDRVQATEELVKNLRDFLVPELPAVPEKYQSDLVALVDPGQTQGNVATRLPMLLLAMQVYLMKTLGLLYPSPMSLQHLLYWPSNWAMFGIVALFAWKSRFTGPNQFIQSEHPEGKGSASQRAPAVGCASDCQSVWRVLQHRLGLQQRTDDLSGIAALQRQAAQVKSINQDGLRHHLNMQKFRDHWMGRYRGKMAGTPIYKEETIRFYTMQPLEITFHWIIEAKKRGTAMLGARDAAQVSGLQAAKDASIILRFACTLPTPGEGLLSNIPPAQSHRAPTPREEVDAICKRLADGTITYDQADADVLDVMERLSQRINSELGNVGNQSAASSALLGASRVVGLYYGE